MGLRQCHGMDGGGGGDSLLVLVQHEADVAAALVLRLGEGVQPDLGSLRVLGHPAQDI